MKFKFTKSEKIALFLALLIMVMLFILSSMTYKQQKFSPDSIRQKFGWIEAIIKNWNICYGGVWHNRISDNGLANFTQFFVRKLAHFGSYFLLGLFLFYGLRRIFVLKWTAPIFVWTTTITYAVSDEFHQFLTGDRTPSVHDVVLDGSGSLLAIILLVIYFMIRKYLRKNKG